jgi:hypothetical protein
MSIDIRRKLSTRHRIALNQVETGHLYSASAFVRVLTNPLMKDTTITLASAFW